VTWDNVKTKLATAGKWAVIIFIIWEVSQMILGVLIGVYTVMSMYGYI
jgi:hypothetical protein